MGLNLTGRTVQITAPRRASTCVIFTVDGGISVRPSAVTSRPQAVNLQRSIAAQVLRRRDGL